MISLQRIKVFSGPKNVVVSSKKYDAIKLLNDNRLFPSLMNLSKIGLARDKVMNNERDIDLESLIPLVAKDKLKFHDGLIQRYFAETLLNFGDQYFSEAEKLINKAIDSDKQKGIMWHLARDYATYAEWFKQKSDLPKARENLSKAVEIFKDCGADGWVKKYKKELVSLS